MMQPFAEAIIVLLMELLHEKELKEQCALLQEIKFPWIIASFNLPRASTYWTTRFVFFF